MDAVASNEMYLGPSKGSGLIILFTPASVYFSSAITNCRLLVARNHPRSASATMSSPSKSSDTKMSMQMDSKAKNCSLRPKQVKICRDNIIPTADHYSKQ